MKDTAWVGLDTSVAVIVLVTDAPWTTDLLPPFESEKSNDGAAFTVSVNEVVRTTLPPVPVTVIVELPVGVDDEAVMVIVVLQVGLQDAGPNDADAPAGRPDAVNDTDCVGLDTSVAVIVLVTDDPWTTERLPAFEREKSNDGGLVTVNPPTSVPNCASGFVTTTSHGPVAAPFKLNAPPLIVVLFGTENPTPVISSWPDFASLTVLLPWKFWPLIFVMLTRPVFSPLDGVMDETDGAVDGGAPWDGRTGAITSFEPISKSSLSSPPSCASNFVRYFWDASAALISYDPQTYE